MTTRPWDTRASAPAGGCARKAWIWACVDRGEVGGIRGVLGPDHAAGQQGQAVLAGPPRGAEAGAAVPDALGQPGRVRLDPVGELLDALDAAERAGRLAP